MPDIQRFTALAALLAGLSVALGAFGSHALETMVTPERLQTWGTAVHYHMIHSIALLWLGLYLHHYPRRGVMVSAGLILAGTLVFSGSLYALVLLNIPVLGAITPIGGLLLISGWFTLAWYLIRKH
ncbi:DUF423 domain-containing protein [Saccharospirillum impatiens]|uniref:DUF423 domain-containing protein n=1 Tax=Saccharospirillum impatiens TaxID=169438 RepID=UPI0003FF1820|nr:DUF423 domain-containing protein [Saccharospirillum impatiens]